MASYGLVIGKFLPPHRGHEYLINFARGYATNVVVHVCSTPSDPIPGGTRFRWMVEHFGLAQGVIIVHNTDKLPQTPAESSSEESFYEAWRESIVRLLPYSKVDYVFASESYGKKLAKCLGAEYIPVDEDRESFPISGTRLRNNLYNFGSQLLPEARSYFMRRVAIIGPESSGKTFLTHSLAQGRGVPYAREYARGYLAARPESWIDPETGINGFSANDAKNIVFGQQASVMAMEQQSEKLLVLSDTEAIVTACWSEVLLGYVPDAVQAAVEESRFNLYLLASATERWVDDSQRIQPNFSERKAFEQSCLRYLNQLRRPYVQLTGTWGERDCQARQAINDLMARPSLLEDNRSEAV